MGLDSVLTVQCRWVTGSLLFTTNVFSSEDTSNHRVHKMSIIFLFTLGKRLKLPYTKTKYIYICTNTKALHCFVNVYPLRFISLSP
jgi:hypothetical protein